MKTNLRKAIRKLCLDLCIVPLFLLPLLLYNGTSVVPIARNGFFCGDLAIRFPYRSSTMPSQLHVLCWFAIAITMILTLEFFLYMKYRATLERGTFHPMAVEVYRALGYFFVGASVTQILTDMCKSSIGRLRPHFIELCRPNVTCTPDNAHEYIEDYVCLRTSHPLIAPSSFDDKMNDSRKSFPSGHASLAIFASFYLIVFIEHRLRLCEVRMPRHLLQTAVLAWALWDSSTRIFDFKHRFSDIAAGMVLGAAIGAFIARIYLKSRQSFLRKMGEFDSGSSSETRELVNDANGSSNSSSSLQPSEDVDSPI